MAHICYNRNPLKKEKVNVKDYNWVGLNMQNKEERAIELLVNRSIIES